MAIRQFVRQIIHANNKGNKNMTPLLALCDRNPQMDFPHKSPVM